MTRGALPSSGCCDDCEFTNGVRVGEGDARRRSGVGQGLSSAWPARRWRRTSRSGWTRGSTAGSKGLAVTTRRTGATASIQPWQSLRHMPIICRDADDNTETCHAPQNQAAIGSADSSHDNVGNSASTTDSVQLRRRNFRNDVGRQPRGVSRQAAPGFQHYRRPAQADCGFQAPR